MTLSELRSSYVVISPVKDEEKYIERTIKSILSQTIKPARWIIADDGSRDRTPEIIERATRGTDWIRYLRIDRDGERKLGITEIRAFSIGLSGLGDLQYDFIVKLDCDVELQPGYFEMMMQRFASNPRLGIASGAYAEEHNGEWVVTAMPYYHAAGASKMVKAECFQSIGAFVQEKGWDTIDEIRARSLGWETCHFQDLTFLHLKREGSASGFVYTSLLEAHVDYVTGCSKLFFLLKVFHRMVTKRPFVLTGLVMLWGFLKEWIRRRARLVSGREMAAYRRLLHERMRDGLHRSLFALHPFMKGRKEWGI